MYNYCTIDHDVLLIARVSFKYRLVSEVPMMNLCISVLVIVMMRIWTLEGTVITDVSFVAVVIRAFSNLLRSTGVTMQQATLVTRFYHAKDIPAGTCMYNTLQPLVNKTS